MQVMQVCRLAAIVISLSSLFFACKTNTLQGHKQVYRAQNHSLKDWEGTYKGDMYLYNAQSPDTPMAVDVTLEIYPTDIAGRWTWRTTYDSQKYGKSVKDYVLVKPDSLPASAYWIDEGNGLLIHHTYLNNVFYCNFKAGEMFIQSRTELLPSEQILMEVVAQPKQVIYSVEGSDFLECYPTTSIQKAILTKVAVKNK